MTTIQPSYAQEVSNNMVDGAGSVSGFIEIGSYTGFMAAYIPLFAETVNHGPYNDITLAGSAAAITGTFIGGWTLVCKNMSKQRKLAQAKQEFEKVTISPIVAKCSYLAGKFMGVAAPVLVATGVGLGTYYALTRPAEPAGAQTTQKIIISGDVENKCSLKEVELFRALSLPPVYVLPNGCELTPAVK